MDKIIRPKAAVLPESALVPEQNMVQPPPKQFTHEVVVEQPYYYVGPQHSTPQGNFPAGTKVAMLAHESGPLCRVADGRGLSVFTAFDGLRVLRQR